MHKQSSQKYLIPRLRCSLARVDNGLFATAVIMTFPAAGYGREWKASHGSLSSQRCEMVAKFQFVGLTAFNSYPSSNASQQITQRGRFSAETEVGTSSQ